jgi:transaldolase
MDRLQALHDAGVSIWLDTLSRDLLDSGEFARLIAESSVTGATSNPTIFAAAMTGSISYDHQLQQVLDAGDRDPREMFLALALADVRRAADLLRPVYDATAGADGFISFECTPDLADDTEATISQARELWHRIDRPNSMIKVPATAAGVEAIRVLTGDGINVNVTLLFSVDRYAQVLDAFQRGLEERTREGRPIRGIASVASFFVSRVDTKADAMLPEGSSLRGTVAVANAGAAYALHTQEMAGQRWQHLAKAGARSQRPLWASTGTKNPAYSDVLYVESLIAPGVVNTMPRSTLEAFADHGDATPVLAGSPADPSLLSRAAAEGVDLDRITAQLEREGVESFCTSYEQLLTSIEKSVVRLTQPG